MRNCATLFVLLCCALAHGEEKPLYPFERLFTETSERRQLDLLKRGIRPDAERPPGTVTAVEPASLAEERVPPQQIVFSGYIQRADGTTVVWVDGTADMSGKSASAVNGILQAGSGEAVFRSAAGKAILKPGQTWLIEEDTISEVYRFEKPPAPGSENP